MLPTAQLAGATFTALSTSYSSFPDPSNAEKLGSTSAGGDGRTACDTGAPVKSQVTATQAEYVVVWYPPPLPLPPQRVCR